MIGVAVRFLLRRLGVQFVDIRHCGHITYNGGSAFTAFRRGTADTEWFMCTKCGLIEGEECTKTGLDEFGMPWHHDEGRG